MNNDLIFEKSGHIVTLTMNRPDDRNPLGMAGDGDNFAEAAERINNDNEVRCVILTGAGSAFSAGGNLKAMRDREGTFGASPLEMREQAYRKNIHRVVRSLWDIEVPTIGAINGPAIGLGNDVGCTCDIRIAADSAKFGATFLKVGLIPGDGGSWLLPRVIGWSNAARLFFTGDIVDAETARGWGLVSDIVPAAELMSEANKLAARIAQQPPQALRMTKRLMRDGMSASFDTIMEMSASMQVIVQNTEDHLEAVNAFFDKRTPVFKGK
jgi:enoyl-CoA hydratase/carnithine racemase